MGQAQRLEEAAGAARAKRGSKLRLIDCVDASRPNLAITSLEPVEGIRAAKVPWFMEVAVQNFGPPRWRRTFPCCFPRTTAAARGGLTIAEIPPGEVVKERFPVYFPTAGEHFDHRPARPRRRRDRQFPLCRGRSAGRGAGAAGRRRSGGRRRPLPRLGLGARRASGHRRQAGHRDAVAAGEQAAGALPGHLPEQRRSPRPLRPSAPWSSTSATAAAWPSSSARGPTAGLSTSRSIATARGRFPCRWRTRPSCCSIAWRRRRTWKWTPTISFSASSPTAATAS